MDIQLLRSLFGQYVPESALTDQGVDWNAIAEARIAQVNPDLVGKGYMLDFGGEGTKYIKDYEYTGGNQDLIADAKSMYSYDADPDPYNLEVLGLPDMAYGAWIPTGDISKTTDKWKRGDAQTYPNFSFVSFIDDATVDPTKIDPRYRTLNQSALTYQSGSDSAGNETTGLTPEAQFMQQLGNLSQAQRGIDSESGQGYWYNAYVPTDLNGVDVGKYLTYNHGQEGAGSGTTVDYTGLLSELKDSGINVDQYFYDPRQATAGVYKVGKEGVLMPSAAGYAPTTDFSYGRGGFEGFLGDVGGFIENIGEQHASWAPIAMSAAMGGIGLAAMPATTGMSLGAAMAANAPAWVPAAVMGAVGQGAATGQKTNDPWAIFGGAASGAVGGALSGGALAGLGGLTSAAGGEVGDLAFNMGANDAISQGIAKGTEAALNSGVNTLLRQGSSGDLDLGNLGTSLATGAVGGGITSASGGLSSTLKSLGITNNFLNETATEGILKGVQSAAGAAIGGSDVMSSAAFGMTQSALTNALDYAAQQGSEFFDKAIAAYSTGDPDQVAALGPAFEDVADKMSYTQWDLLRKNDPDFMTAMLETYNSNNPNMIEMFNKEYGTNIGMDDLGTIAGYVGYVANTDAGALPGDFLDMGDRNPSEFITNNLTSTPSSKGSAQIANAATKMLIPQTSTSTSKNVTQTTASIPNNLLSSNSLIPFKRFELPEQKLYNNTPLELGTNLTPYTMGQYNPYQPLNILAQKRVI